ncbi:sugar ABC transporter ATP-binding protein [Nakamurella leprariae]|uniref:Sugar ABC transporter ATP-binding protein n=1 Tax=Nakamurella leprariae TaxID=2803911 RepID=A0A939C099_9ACTN|nr:sugar ABC transporter ATP-binding protein [Nakamurella leprariae]MBM9468536.1 sugar ABC transporter ATP-binding protein [Nakamurella leprariae]
MQQGKQAAGGRLVATGLRKQYGGVFVLKGVDFTITRGRVTGLIGENGAGKSTLSSIIAGIRRPDGGAMTIDSVPYQPSGPSDALDQGVAIIHQEIKMIPELSVAENMFLGRMPTRRGAVARRSMHDQARAALDQLGVRVDPRRPVAGLSTAAQQEIEIARAIIRRPAFVIFDEPSASLGNQETERVLEQIELLRAQGSGVVYISHRLEEISRIADDVVCLRDGRSVAGWEAADVDRDAMIRAMVGRELAERNVGPPPHRDRTVMQVRSLGSTRFTGIDFDLREGEILGVSGLVGAGRSEIVRALAGADRFDTGQVLIGDVPVRIRSVQDAITAGIVMVPEDRKTQGLNLDRRGGENMTLPWESRLTRSGLITDRVVRDTQCRMAQELDIRGDLDAPVGLLSGGNQQKVLLAKWLVRTPKVLILDEPTRGVDVGAKDAIYTIIRSLAASGVGVVVVSSELEEVLLLAHRVLIVAGGRQTGLLDRAEATPERVMELSVPAGRVPVAQR